MKGSTALHQNLVKDFMIAVSKTFPGVLVLPYTVGMFRAFDNPDRIIRAGIKGVPDLVVFGENFWLFFDAKTGKARLTKEQKAFFARIGIVQGRQCGFKLTSVEEGIETVRGFYETNG